MRGDLVNLNFRAFNKLSSGLIVKCRNPALRIFEPLAVIVRNGKPRL